MANDPHDLVTELAKALKKKNVGQPHVALQAIAANATDAQVTDALAKESNLPELVTFAGFLGGKLSHAGASWRVLYLDWRLQTWLLVRDDEIIFTRRVDDDSVPFKTRDVIWVRADTSVGRGSGSQPVEARFLTGAFTRAGDFDASPTGSTIAASTGVFCEARTAGCCYYKTRY